VYRAFFVDDRNVGDATVALDIAQSLGIDTARLAAGVQEEAIKTALRVQVEQAIARDVFGAPTIFVDGEMFWGHDRLDQVERWISRGPF
jgi:2-hydroxychromene-2-carboxylate isomerase